MNVADGDAVTAEVVGQGAGNFSRSLVISKGSSSGIALGQPVVWGVNGKAALVGTIVRLSANRATVQRIDDPSFGVGAELMPTGAEGAKGIAVGQRGQQPAPVLGDRQQPHRERAEEGRHRDHARRPRRPEVSAADW